MNKYELIDYILKSSIINKWHWFYYHFSQYQFGLQHPFAESVVESCLECEEKITGFAKDMIDNLSYLSGKVKDEGHYQQLLQRLAEILVIKQIVGYNWPDDTRFLWEEPSETSKKNPELIVDFNNKRIGVEVKSPSLLNHIRQRSTSEYQLTERNDFIKTFAKEDFQKQKIVYPRDNVVMEFLKSADEKYKGFKERDKDFYGVLVIVWDDYIYEPITALISEASGLFTNQSFAKEKGGNILRFNNVDGVVIIRHMDQFINAAAEKPLLDNFKHALDYGKPGEFPFKAYIPNPYGKEVPREILDCLQANLPDVSWGAEYIPQNLVFWFHI